MSIESVRAFFAEKVPDIAVIESTISSATVVLAAEAYGVEPARIAKTLSLRVGDRVVLIVAAGTSRMDNKKVKAAFGAAKTPAVVEVYPAKHGWCVKDGAAYNPAQAERAWAALIGLYARALA